MKNLLTILSLLIVANSYSAVNACTNATSTYTDFCGGGSCSYYHDAYYSDGTVPTQWKSGGVLYVVWPHPGMGKIAIWVDTIIGWQTIIVGDVTITDCLNMSTPTFLCSGNSRSFIVTDTNASTSYTWTVPSGWTINGGSNTLITSSTSVTIVVSNPSTHGYNPITVVSNNSGSRTFNVWVGAPAAASVYVAGLQNVDYVNLQQSTSYSFYSKAVGATSHMWFLPSAFHWSTGVTSGSPVQITTANYGGTFSIHTKSSNTCGSSLSNILHVVLPGTGEEENRKASDGGKDDPIAIDEPERITTDVPYPIPSRDHMNINLSQPSSIKMFDLRGAIVRDIMADGQTIISTDDLSEGVYLLKVQNQKEVRQFKVSIRK